MSAITLLRKPIGTAAAVLGMLQGITWFVLTLLGVLLYNCALDLPFTIDDPSASSSQYFLLQLSTMYFLNTECANFTAGEQIIANTMKPSDVQIWVIVNLAFNFLWMASSIYYLQDVVRPDRPLASCYVWISVTSCVLILDLATTIIFGLDYGVLANALDNMSPPFTNAPAILAIPVFMMSMAARGYILWIVNDLLVIFLITSILTERKESRANTRDLSRQGSFTNPAMNRMWPEADDMYHQPTQASRDAWDPPTPTQNQTPMYPYSIARPMSPASEPSHIYSSPPPIILQDPPRGRASMHTAPAPATTEPQRHIPSPDYSPPLNHRPMLPLRPALRKPPGNIGEIGRTVF